MTDTRWFCDRGALPGEPCAYLDVPYDSLEYASAIIIDTGYPDQTAYQAILFSLTSKIAPLPEDHSPKFTQLLDAYAWAEARVPRPLQTIPLGIEMELCIQERYRPQPDEVLIAITEPGRRPITPLGTFVATYHLAAWDLPRTIDHPKYGRMGPLTIHDAAPLLEFVLRHCNTMSKLVIYCHAGVARSPAVAIALSEWLPTSPHTYQLIETHPCFNRPTYRALCQAAIERGLLLA